MYSPYGIEYLFRKGATTVAAVFVSRWSINEEAESVETDS